MTIAVIFKDALADDYFTAQLQRAEYAYQRGDYRTAIEIYNSLLHYGYEQGEILYNLGNAYMQVDEYGRAIACYERAVKLLPRDSDVLVNLALAYTAARVQPYTPANNLEALCLQLRRWVSINELALITSILFMLTCILGAMAIISTSILPRWRERCKSVAICALTIFALCALLLLVRAVADTYPPRAVVVVKTATVRDGPGTMFDKIAQLRNGTVIRIRQRKGIWLHGITNSGMRGWIAIADVEFL